MQYREYGRTGYKVSQIGFGGAGAGNKNYLRRWDPSSQENIDSVEQALTRAVELGINYFDTAPKYNSEEMYGRALKPYRDQIVLATKVWAQDADGTRKSLETSLRRLQMEYVDVLQFHGDWYWDEEVENLLKPDGVLAGMRKLQDEGLVKFIGLAAEGMDANLYKLIATGEFDVLQMQYNLLFQHACDPSKDAGVLYDAEKQDMGLAIMRPFTGGTFSRWMELAHPDLLEQIDMKKVMTSLLSFVLSNPLTDVALVGMRSVERVEQNCAICDDLSNRIDLDELYGRFLRSDPGADKEVWTATSGRQSDDESLEY